MKKPVSREVLANNPWGKNLVLNPICQNLRAVVLANHKQGNGHLIVDQNNHQARKPKMPLKPHRGNGPTANQREQILIASFQRWIDNRNKLWDEMIAKSSTDELRNILLIGTGDMGYRKKCLIELERRIISEHEQR